MFVCFGVFFSNNDLYPNNGIFKDGDGLFVEKRKVSESEDLIPTLLCI